ncbi:MAG: Hsp20/alpha crystallin family protein [Candidatus Caenarcaniphilales bacterium]|nr:Hsp20/alpha crystallin family protein [Candidatus Caenarcaniphilales bacterium]
MSLGYWDPFHEMEELLKKFRNYPRTGFLALPSRDDGGVEVGSWIPSVDIDETTDEFIIRLELPGVDKKDVNIQVENGMLVIRGEKRSTKENKEVKSHRYECSYGSFIRSFSLPRGVKTDNFPDAEIKNGVLELKLLKSEESKPKQIEIKIK